jgi:hypothetical protein
MAVLETPPRAAAHALARKTRQAADPRPVRQPRQSLTRSLARLAGTGLVLAGAVSCTTTSLPDIFHIGRHLLNGSVVGAPVFSGPSQASRSVGHLRYNATVQVICFTQGPAASIAGDTSDVWYKTKDGYIPGVYLRPEHAKESVRRC